MTTLKQLRATAETIRYYHTLQETEDLIVALIETVTCKEGVCDGSGEVAKEIIDSETHAPITDGTRKCVCQLEN